MRLLVIDDDPQFRRLLRHHVMCRWPLATIVEYDPVARGALATEVRAQNFDAVLLDHSWTVPAPRWPEMSAIDHEVDGASPASGLGALDGASSGQPEDPLISLDALESLNRIGSMSELRPAARLDLPESLDLPDPLELGDAVEGDGLTAAAPVLDLDAIPQVLAEPEVKALELVEFPRAPVAEADAAAKPVPAQAPQLSVAPEEPSAAQPAAVVSPGLQWLQDLAQRPGFAPIVFLAEHRGDAASQQALAAGASAVFGKDKLEHEALLEAIAAAATQQEQARAVREDPGGRYQAYRFSGVRIPGYRRIRRLASGQVSELYLAENEVEPELVAIKVARRRVRETELDDSFRRFLQEHEIVQRIRHPGVMRLYDLGVSDEHAYLVMEYFPLGDLRRRMRKGLAPVEALRIARDVAQALQGIHEAGVLHRDLKPGNVMLRNDGSLALIDFGMAKHAALQRDITDHGLIFGTPHYMSPEQGHGETLDPRSDLYSLGVMLFEMLTRQKPFTAENPMAVIYLHRNAPLPILPDAFAGLQRLLDQLLAKRAVDRFPSAAAAADALDEALRQVLGAELAA